jgi:flagellar protein FliT
MPAMPSPIELYQEISVLSSQMVEAAQKHDWERLVHLEKAIAVLRNTLLSGADSVVLSAEERDAKGALIQRILDDDAEIRRHTEPWMERVRKFLGHGAKRHLVERAYGASSSSFG